MKTKIRNYGTVALFVALSLTTTAVMATGRQGEKPGAELKYIGNINDRPVFQLDLNGTQVENYSISIKDEYGEVLYNEKIKAKSLTRKFQLDTDELGDAILRVEVKSYNGSKPEVFKINRETHFVEENSVSKL